MTSITTNLYSEDRAEYNENALRLSLAAVRQGGMERNLYPMEIEILDASHGRMITEDDEAKHFSDFSTLYELEEYIHTNDDDITNLESESSADIVDLHFQPVEMYDKDVFEAYALLGEADNIRPGKVDKVRSMLNGATPEDYAWKSAMNDPRPVGAQFFNGYEPTIGNEDKVGTAGMDPYNREELDNIERRLTDEFDGEYAWEVDLEELGWPERMDLSNPKVEKLGKELGRV